MWNSENKGTLRPFYYPSPTVELSPEASTMTLPSPFCAQSSPIFTSFPAGIDVVIHHLKHSLPILSTTFFFFSLAPSGQNPQPWINLTSAFCAPNPGYRAPWEGREKNHITAWLGHCKVRISHLDWDLNAALKIHLYHCFFLFSATAVSNLYHFLQVYDLITASLTFSRQSGENARLPLLSPLLTKISAAHTRALPSPPATSTEGVPFHLCSGSLLRLLRYKLFLFSPTSSNYFFC